jgi:hypothetical protein
MCRMGQPVLKKWKLVAERPMAGVEWRGAVLAALGDLDGLKDAHDGRRSPMFSLGVTKDPAVAYVAACSPAVSEALERSISRWILGNEPLRNAVELAFARPDELIPPEPGARRCVVKICINSPCIMPVSTNGAAKLAALFEPNQITKQLLKSWNDNIAISLPGNPLNLFWHTYRQNVFLVPLISYDNVKLLGVVGYAKIIAEGDEGDIASAVALWKYATFAGIGAKRTVGAGSVSTIAILSRLPAIVGGVAR